MYIYVYVSMCIQTWMWVFLSAPIPIYTSYWKCSQFKLRLGAIYEFVVILLLFLLFLFFLAGVPEKCDDRLNINAKGTHKNSLLWQLWANFCFWIMESKRQESAQSERERERTTQTLSVNVLRLLSVRFIFYMGFLFFYFFVLRAHNALIA